MYLLIDPRDQSVFYVGKGKGNRIEQHLLDAVNEDTVETEKIKKIRDIQNSGLDVSHVVLRHGLIEKEALEVESAIIDILGEDNITNILKGHNSEDRGIMDLTDIKIKYEAIDVKVEDPMILININNNFQRNLSTEEIYEVTRKSWKISMKSVANIKIACAVYRGIIREVFVINKWLPSLENNGRFEFEGVVASKNIREKYLNKSVAKYWKQGSQNPIKYVAP